MSALRQVISLDVEKTGYAISTKKKQFLNVIKNTLESFNNEHKLNYYFSEPLLVNLISNSIKFYHPFSGVRGILISANQEDDFARAVIIIHSIYLDSKLQEGWKYGQEHDTFTKESNTIKTFRNLDPIEKTLFELLCKLVDFLFIDSLDDKEKKELFICENKKIDFSASEQLPLNNFSSFQPREGVYNLNCEPSAPYDQIIKNNSSEITLGEIEIAAALYDAPNS